MDLKCRYACVCKYTYTHVHTVLYSKVFTLQKKSFQEMKEGEIKAQKFLPNQFQILFLDELYTF